MYMNIYEMNEKELTNIDLIEEGKCMDMMVFGLTIG
jgi:hypothetical protein